MKYYRPYYNAIKKRKACLKRILKLSGYFVFAGLLVATAAFAYFAKDLPDPSTISHRQITQSTKIYDRTGTVLLYDVHGEEKRTIVALDQISPNLKNATISVEDANFYNHFGLDFKGIGRAIIGVLTGNRSAGGGSTITQQFIKKSFFSDKRSYTRKVKEWILSLELEAKYSKDEILGFYLNQIPYGSNAYGAEAAAQTFFNKSAKDLNLAEGALLASLPQAPSYYSPFGSHPEELKSRQEYVLDRMAKLGYISAEEAEAAKKEQLNFSKTAQSIKASHFVMYIKEYLEEKYGQETVEKGGLKVYTTLDIELQEAAQEIINQGAADNQKKYGAYNAALTAVDPKTGQILAMAGSRDDTADSLPTGCTPGDTCRYEPYVNVSIRDRQPGSSFKPFAFATAFKKGFTPETMLFDLKTEFAPACPASATAQEFEGQRCYNPDNYDGKFRGPVSMREALAQSLNVPSVKTLYLAGINQTIETAKSMGITTLNDRSRYGLALVLGGGEVKLLDETAAFGVFAADGIKNKTAAILKIEDGKGKILEEYESNPTKIIDPQISRMVTDILSDNEARSPVFGANSPLYLTERPAAVKTGTTQEYRDAWTIGYTPSLAVGVWAGNNDNTPMAKAGAGMYAAAPLWNAFMKKAYQIASSRQDAPENSFILPSEPEAFTKPDSTPAAKSILNGSYVFERIVKIDKISGKLATDMTPPDLIEEKVYPEVHTILFYIDKDNPLGDAPKDPTADPQFNNWEAPIRAWAVSSGWVPQQQPDSSDDVHTQENIPSITINSPLQNQVITQRRIQVSASAVSNLGIKQVDFFFDDELIGADTKDPSSVSFRLPSRLNGSMHTIKAVAYDSFCNRKEALIDVLINSPEIQIE
ncbi:MAG: PBP1A family penicillin-binding protein [Candidatus Portnoybacteria bacterium]|nr:PBP1A family penicillin-binding protein [Candidatus Portnoybacteria bacterium]